MVRRRFTFGTLLATSFMVALAAAAAYAGGHQISAQAAPYDIAKRGGALVVSLTNCGLPSSGTMSGTAEGLINGRRQSIPLKLLKTSKRGVYAVTRQWPIEGTWVLRLESRGPHPVGALVELRPEHAAAAAGGAPASGVAIASVRTFYHAVDASEVETSLRTLASL